MRPWSNSSFDWDSRWSALIWSWVTGRWFSLMSRSAAAISDESWGFGFVLSFLLTWAGRWSDCWVCCWGWGGCWTWSPGGIWRPGGWGITDGCDAEVDLDDAGNDDNCWFAYSAGEAMSDESVCWTVTSILWSKGLKSLFCIFGFCCMMHHLSSSWRAMRSSWGSWQWGSDSWGGRMILLNSIALNCWCSCLENLTFASHDVHSSGNTFSQPQWVVLLRLSPQMKLLGGRGGLNMSQNSFPEMIHRTSVSIVEHPLVWWLTILTNEVPVDGEDGMLNDPRHETSCCRIRMNYKMSSESGFDCPDLTIKSLVKPFKSSLTFHVNTGLIWGGNDRSVPTWSWSFARPEWPAHWRTLWVNPLTMMSCLMALISTWCDERSVTMTAPHIDVEVSTKVWKATRATETWTNIPLGKRLPRECRKYTRNKGWLAQPVGCKKTMQSPWDNQHYTGCAIWLFAHLWNFVPVILASEFQTTVPPHPILIILVGQFCLYSAHITQG